MQYCGNIMHDLNHEKLENKGKTGKTRLGIDNAKL